MPRPFLGGRGNYFEHIVPVKGQALGKGAKKDDVYIAIDGIQWFVNMQSNIFSKRMLGATLKVDIGDQNYQMVLGTFEPKAGAKTAPFMKVELVPPTPYRGGTIRFQSIISALANDTALAGLLKTVAASTITAVGSSVSFGTATPAAVALGAAVSSTIDGVNGLLTSESAKKREVFGADGFALGLNPETDCRSQHTYVLLRRGRKGLVAKEFAINEQGGDVVFTHDGEEFEDGAWMLLRIRLEETFDNRPWQAELRKAIGRIDTLMTRYELGSVDKDALAKALTPSSEGGLTVGDALILVLDTIDSDTTIIEADRLAYAQALRTVWKAARQVAGPGGDVDAYRTVRSSTEFVD